MATWDHISPASPSTQLSKGLNTATFWPEFITKQACLVNSPPKIKKQLRKKEKMVTTRSSYHTPNGPPRSPLRQPLVVLKKRRRSRPTRVNPAAKRLESLFSNPAPLPLFHIGPTSPSENVDPQSTSSVSTTPFLKIKENFVLNLVLHIKIKKPIS